MRLFRISNLLSLVVATFFGVLLFWTSQSVQTKEGDLSKARKNLVREQETFRVLSVEWDYLNRPQRLEKLATEQLGMKPAGSKGVLRTVSDIPEPIDMPMTEEGYTQAVSFGSVPKAKAKVPEPETVSPARAEKQSFDRLIQSLDAESGAQ